MKKIYQVTTTVGKLPGFTRWFTSASDLAQYINEHDSGTEFDVKTLNDPATIVVCS